METSKSVTNSLHQSWEDKNIWSTLLIQFIKHMTRCKANPSCKISRFSNSSKTFISKVIYHTNNYNKSPSNWAGKFVEMNKKKRDIKETCVAGSLACFCRSCFCRAWFSSDILILLERIWDCTRERVCMHLRVLQACRFTTATSVSDFSLTRPLKALNALLA